MDSPDCRIMRPYIELARRVHSPSVCGALIGSEEKGQSSNSSFTGTFFCVSCSCLISCVRSSYPKSPIMSFWVLEIPSPEAVFAQDVLGQSQWGDSAICWQSGSLIFQHSRCWDAPVTPETQMDSAPTYLDGIRVLCAPVSIKALYSMPGHQIHTVQ